MPIITFHGVPKTAVEAYYQKLDELSQLIKAHPDNIFFVVNDHDVVLNSQKSAFITVNWLKRENQEQLLVQNLKNFFAPFVEKVIVFFTDANGKLYLNEQRLG